MTLHPMQRIACSSTAWFGGIVAALSAFASTTQFALPPWLSTAMVLAYGLKEAAAKIANPHPVPTAPEVRP